MTTDGLQIFGVIRGAVASFEIIAGGEAQNRGEGIEFVFSFVDAGLHGGVIGLEFADFVGGFVEGVGVGVEEDAAGLAMDEAAREARRLGTVAWRKGGRAKLGWWNRGATWRRCRP